MDTTYFYGLALTPLPGLVMSPRPASEQLAAVAIELVADRRAVVADVGTGSGAIAVAIAKAAPRARVWATDTSPCAVALARANVLRHRLGDRVTVRRGDLLDPVPGPVDVIVANLPYLPAGDDDLFPDLAAEPHDAIYAAGDGLEPYRRLLTASAGRLTRHGALVIQLHRRVVAATRDEIGELRAGLEAVPLGYPARPARLSRAEGP